MSRFPIVALAALLLGAVPVLAEEADKPAADVAPTLSAPQATPTSRAPKPLAKPHSEQPASQPGPEVTTKASEPAPQLPNGASSITETYGDWTVACGIDNGAKLCALSQAQGNKETGQRSFAIELRSPKDGKTIGTIMMPLGPKLEAGAILKLDDKDLGQGLRFSTCTSRGCFLPVSFPSVATDAMRKGKMLLVAALNLSNDQAVTFKISLNGFAAALDRIAQLGN